MTTFEKLYQEACTRKGGEESLKSLISDHPSDPNLQKLGSDRVLAHMTKGIFQAGFVWKIIEQKWPGFEETFLGFDLEKLRQLRPSDWLGFQENPAIVRNGQKIMAVEQNLHFILEIESKEKKPIAKIIADWPEEDLISLWALFKKKGSRLGGMTGQYLLRRLGKDSFILSKDVISSLQRLGLPIANTPNAQKDLKLIQETFNQLTQKTGLTYTETSKVLAYATGPIN